MEYHNEQQLHKLAPGTMKNYYTTQRHVKAFLKEKLYRNDIALSQLKYKFILDFERYLFNYVPKDHQKPLNHNGIMKHVERPRRMINMAIRVDCLAKDPFASFKKRFDKVERESMNSEVLAALVDKVLSINWLQHFRNMFVFSCYPGLSYIELAELTPNKIITGLDGGLLIPTSRAKTDTSVRVPLLPVATDLMEKYRDDPRALNNGTAFLVEPRNERLSKRNR